MESMGLLTVTGLREPGLERTQSAWKFEPALPPMPGDGPSITHIQRIRKLVTTRPAKSGTGRGISKGSSENGGTAQMRRCPPRISISINPRI